MATGPSAHYEPGDNVKVVDGTFIGLEGVILSQDEVVSHNPEVRISREFREGKVCWVLLPIFDKTVPVELESWQMVHSITSRESD
jgi:transcription antitermination factor NusG